MIKCTILQNHKKYYYYSVKVDIIEYFYGKGVWQKGAWLQNKSTIFKNSTQIFFEALGMPNLNQHSN